MLATWLPIAAAAVFVLAVWSGKRQISESPESNRLGKSAHLGGGLCLAIGLLSVLAGFTWQTSFPGILQAGIGALIGSFVAAIAGFLGSRFDSNHENRYAPIALGALAIALCAFFPADVRNSGILGVCFGISTGAWILGVAPSAWPSSAATSAFGIGITSIFGTYGYGDLASQFPIIFALAIVVVGIVAETAVPKSAANRSSFLPIVLAVFGAGIAYLLASKFAVVVEVGSPATPVEGGNLGTLAMLAAGGALVTHWVLPSNRNANGATSALAVLLWIGLATIAFGIQSGFGIATLFVSASILLLCFGNARAILALGPIAAITAFRLLKEMSDSTKALDIGQHYGMMGLVVGATIVVIGVEWLRSIEAKSDSKTVIAGALWTGIFISVPACIAIVLGAKGFVGAVAGIGFGSVIALLIGSNRALPFQALTALLPLMLLEYPWLTEKLDLTRDLKVQSLIGFAVVLVTLSAAIGWLSRPESAPDGA